MIVTSDHGELHGEHGLVEHQFALHEPLLHVPWVASLPGRLPEGLRVRYPISTGRIVPGIR